MATIEPLHDAIIINEAFSKLISRVMASLAYQGDLGRAYHPPWVLFNLTEFTMLKQIHVRPNAIAHNSNPHNDKRPVVTIHDGGEVIQCDGVEILGPSKVVYNPNQPLNTGTKVWIETEAELTVIEHKPQKGQPPSLEEEVNRRSSGCY